MTVVDSPDLTFFRLKAKAQELLPEHTYKAVMHRVEREQETVEGRVEMLAGLLEDFERGME